MARPKLKECSNCHGKEAKCKFNTTGRPCRIGKAKGKAISDRTLNKRERYLEELDDLHYQYTHEQDSKVFWNAKKNRIVKKSISLEHINRRKYKYISFYKWLKIKELHTLASWYKDNCDESLYNYDYEQNYKSTYIY